MPYYKIYIKGVLASGPKTGEQGIVRAATKADTIPELNSLILQGEQEMHLSEVFEPGYVTEHTECTREELLEEFPEMIDNI